MKKNFIFKDRYNTLVAKGESVVYTLPGIKGESCGVVVGVIKGLNGHLISLYDANRVNRKIKLFPEELVFNGRCDRTIPCGMSYDELIDWLKKLDFTQDHSNNDEN